MIYIHVCEMVVLSNKRNQNKHLNKREGKKLPHMMHLIILLLLFKFHLGLTLVVTLCSSIIPYKELYSCFTLEKYPDFLYFGCFRNKVIVVTFSAHVVYHPCHVSLFQTCSFRTHKSCTVC